VKKVELVLWYPCNCACTFCSSHSYQGGRFTRSEAVAQLAACRGLGARSVDFGGGEPTLGQELPDLAMAARDLGYVTIGVKSNGMRLCYPEYVRRCLDAGVNDFSISLWGHTPQLHDALAGRPGAFEMTEMGLKHLVDLGATVCVDFLITTRTVGVLTDALLEISRLGVRSIRLWIFCLFGANGRNVELMPSLSAAGAAAGAAAAAVASFGGRLGTSHIMPCLLGAHAGIYFNTRELDLTVVTKDGSFKAEESPFEAGTRVRACTLCRYAPSCPGPRREYLDLFGDGEFQAVP
jgi:MoaA/NifB/PqqE/SkfB family radical SAM enzyme